jgi:hypothetical protein
MKLDDRTTARCRSCDAGIIWAISEDSGSRIPIDPVPVADGNIVLTMRTWPQSPLAKVQTKAQIEKLRAENEATGQEHLLYKSHFATCPHAKHHRR